MDFAEFLELDPIRVAALVAEKKPRKFGVGIPFNGTRRWYLATFNAKPDALYGQDYAFRTTCRMWEIIGMILDDGVSAVYSPVIGRALAERGAEYMEFVSQSVAYLARNEAIKWYLDNRIAASCYGELHLLPAHVQERINYMRTATQGERYLRYGVFADLPQPDLIARTIRLYERSGVAPTEEQLAEDYYGGPSIPVGIWIGCDQPTVFDVPLAIRENTALYFLQFPTLYLERRTWRRLLYDYLFVRGDEESLYPENLTGERRVTGLGARQDGRWLPSTV